MIAIRLFPFVTTHVLRTTSPIRLPPVNEMCKCWVCGVIPTVKRLRQYLLCGTFVSRDSSTMIGGYGISTLRQKLKPLQKWPGARSREPDPLGWWLVIDDSDDESFPFPLLQSDRRGFACCGSGAAPDVLHIHGGLGGPGQFDQCKVSSGSSLSRLSWFLHFLRH